MATVLRVMSHGTFGRQEEEQVPKVERVQSSDSVYREALHPYQLFSTGSYFGEWELVQTTVPRKTTARCVSEGGGVVLTLNKAVADPCHRHVSGLSKSCRACGVSWRCRGD